MKKILILSLLIFVGFLFSFTFINKTDGASTKTKSISDEFFSSEIDSNIWESNGNASIVNKGGAIQIKKGDFSTSVGWKGLRDVVDKTGNGNGLTSDYSLEVTISCVDTSWFAVYLGSQKSAQRFSSISEGNPASILVFAANNITHYVGQGMKATDSQTVVLDGSEEAQEDAKTYKSVYPINRLEFDGTRYCLKFEAVFGDETGSDRSKNYIDVYCVKEPTGRDKDTVINYGNKIARLYYANVNGYFSFGSQNNGVATFSNIKVTDTKSNEVIYEPKGDLLTPTVEHIVGSGSEAFKDYEFRVWNTSSGQYNNMISNGVIGHLNLKNNSSILSKVTINPDKRLHSIYDVDLKLDIKELGSNSFEVVLATKDEGYESIKITKKLGSKVIFSDSKEKSVEYTLGSGVHDYSFNVKADKTVEVIVDKNVIGKFKLDYVGGSVGLKSSDGQDVNVSLFELNTYEHKSSNSSSVSSDFTLKDPNDEKPYLHPDELYISGNARRLAGYDEIAFINAKRGSFLATKQPYAEYVVKFDLYDLTQNDSANIITFSFAKDTYNADYDSCKTLIFVSREYYEDEMGFMLAGKTNCEALGGLKFTLPTGDEKTSVKLEDNFFNDEEFFLGENGKTAINVMFVVKDRTITLYYKYANEPESELAIPRAVCYDVDTYGYFSIGAASTANFTVSNFSLINLEFE